MIATATMAKKKKTHWSAENESKLAVTTHMLLQLETQKEHAMPWEKDIIQKKIDSLVVVVNRCSDDRDDD